MHVTFILLVHFKQETRAWVIGVSSTGFRLNDFFLWRLQMCLDWCSILNKNLRAWYMNTVSACYMNTDCPFKTRNKSLSYWGKFSGLSAKWIFLMKTSDWFRLMLHFKQDSKCMLHDYWWSFFNKKQEFELLW